MSQVLNTRPDWLDAPLLRSPAAHWSDRYVGMPYADANCGELAALVAREVFGRAVWLPAQLPEGLTAQNATIADLREDFARRLDRPPRDGDPVLLVQGSKRALWHIGVYCEIASVPYVLHALRRINKAVRTRRDQLGRLGFAIEGYYEWRR